MSDRQTFTVYARSHSRNVCKKCRAPIEFYQNASTDKWMPFDPGLEVLRTFPRAIDGLVCHEVAGVSHFATCPQADEFRKEKSPAPKPPTMESLF